MSAFASCGQTVAYALARFVPLHKSGREQMQQDAYKKARSKPIQ
jgi:hypothetical protein